MPTTQIDPEQLLDAALKMSRSELEEFVSKVFALKAREYAPVLSDRESELHLQINRGLPAALRNRLDELIGKRQSHTIAKDELEELRGLTDQIEKTDAERLRCLIELAALRDVPLDELINQLGLKPYPHE